MQVTHTVYNDAPQYRPGQMFAFAPVTGESLVGPKNVLQKQAHIWILTTADISTFF